MNHDIFFPNVSSCHTHKSPFYVLTYCAFESTIWVGVHLLKKKTKKKRKKIVMCDIKRKKEQKIKVAFSFVFAHQEHSKTNHEISKKRVVIL